MNDLLTILEKEKNELFSHRILLLSYGFILLFIGLFLPALIGWEASTISSSCKLPEGYTSLLDLEAEYFLPLIFLFVGPFISLPAIADSFSGEAERKTLESLLSTPIKAYHLYLAKAISLFIFVFSFLLVAFFLFLGVMNFVISPFLGIYGLIFPGPKSFYIIFLLFPLILLLSISLGTVVSFKVRSVKATQIISSFLLLPIILLSTAKIILSENPSWSNLIKGSLLLLVLLIIVSLLGKILFNKERLVLG
ncbi:ABC transporter permease [bacterium]|nr:ABC transporter permease [bacterium]